MADKLEVPRRRISKNWYVGLKQDPVDRSHPDVHDDEIILEAAEMSKTLRKLTGILSNVFHSIMFDVSDSFTCITDSQYLA